MALELQKHLRVEKGFPTQRLALVILNILGRMGKPVEDPEFYVEQLTLDAKAQAITSLEPVDDATADELLKYLRD